MAEVNERTGSRLEMTAVAEHGQSGGAIFVRWPDGRPGVLTRAQASVEQMRRTRDVLGMARSRGLPVPRHDLVVELAGGTVAVVQEYLPGMPLNSTRVDSDTVDAMVAMNDRFAAMLIDYPEVPISPFLVGENIPSVCRASLEHHSERSRRLLRKIQHVGSGTPNEMAGDDLVHPDYHPENVLGDGAGHITGVVDWNLGAGRGDRRFALIKFRFELAWDTLGQAPPDRATIDRLDEILHARIPPDLLRLYWAHWTLRHLHHAIHDEKWRRLETIDLFLDLGETRLF